MRRWGKPALFLLLLMLILSPLALERMGRDYGVARVCTEKTQPVRWAAESGDTPWDRLRILDAPSVARTAWDVKYAIDGGEDGSGLTRDALAMELNGHLEKLREYGALPDLALGTPQMLAYHQETYMARGENFSDVLSVWLVELDFPDATVYAAMDTRAAFLYEARICLDRDILYGEGISEGGFLAYLRDAFPAGAEKTRGLSARAEYGKREIRLYLINAEEKEYRFLRNM